MAAYNYPFPVTYQNPYQPLGFYGFQPQQPQQQIPQIQQPQMQPTSNQPQQPALAQSGILWVTNEQEAQAYPVAPNNAVALWDSSLPAVYIKQADASGKPVLKIYDLTERSETPRSASQPVGDVSALRKEIDGEISRLWAAVDEIRTRADAAKRSPRKKEVTEDDAE